jgi:hypothetical protein
VIDIHQRTKDQVLWDEQFSELMIDNPSLSMRELRRLAKKRFGIRPGGGQGLNAEADRRLG